MNTASTTYDTRSSAPLFSAARIAEIMTVPGEKLLAPTPEQTRVIEHPLGGSALVVAGAGSGKTETMANRVVWLVANGLAAPSEILGLTFTRKAAGELNERIARRLILFVDRISDLAELKKLPPNEAARAAELSALLHDGLDLPQVSTYNAFAASVLQEFGPLAGVASHVTLLDDANAWRIAREIVCASSDPDLVTNGDSISQVVSRVMAIDHAIADNLTSFERTREFLTEFERIEFLPYDEKHQTHTKKYALITKVLANIRGTRVALKLAETYAAEKQRRGLIEFSDQLALAVRTIQNYPPAVQQLRKRTPVVLLDEVQDTSVGQTVLLSTLFAGCSVMAVGDPHQSIYGFRGASADNLRSFHRDFTGPSAAAAGFHDGATLSLSVSWRNPGDVLHVANTLSAPLAEASPIPVPQLRSRESYLGIAQQLNNVSSPHSAVDWVYPETIEEEFEAIAEWFQTQRSDIRRTSGADPSGAVVMRARRDMPLIAEALKRVGIPAQIVGVGGLLSTPEVTEIVSTLRCIWYADAGTDLIRVLASPRFRIGPADLMGLKRAARWFGQRDISQQRIPADTVAGGSPLPDPDREFTLIDTVDAIASLKSLEHRSVAEISMIGRERIREAGMMLRTLRQSVSRDIPVLIRAVEYALRIDIELEANERSPHNGNAASRANIDAFTELVEGFLQTSEEPSLALVLAWLERLGQLDQHAEHVPDPPAGTVQIITVHGAKGLEWDLVAVPRLVSDEFPGKASEGIGWLRPGQLPDELRGDAPARPELNWRIATTQAELRERIEGANKVQEGVKTRIPGYTDALVERHRDEERRLAYVAVTRAAKRLLLSGSFWARSKSARVPSEFLNELHESGIITGLPAESAYVAHPRDRPDRTLQWPLDPLGARTAAVQHAAAQVRSLLTRAESGTTSGDGAEHTGATPSGSAEAGRHEATIDPVVELLIAERAAQHTRSQAASSLAQRITASTFHEFIEDASAAERRRNRPVPMRPFRKTRTGNRFHEWVERRATTARGTALPLLEIDPETPNTERQEFEGEAELQPLIDAYEQSRWGTRQPIAVELEVSMPFAGRQLVCKLDAVFTETVDGHTRYEVVDWKTGRAPKTDSERELRFLQLELYRHAYSQWAGVPLNDIDVTLFYVTEAVELRGVEPRTLSELESLWWAAAARI